MAIKSVRHYENIADGKSGTEICVDKKPTLQIMRSRIGEHMHSRIGD